MTTPTPPRLTGDARTDIDALVKYSSDVYKALVVEQRLNARLSRIAAVAQLSMSFPAPVTALQGKEIADKINEIIAAAQ